jgi:hypothetical protein
MAIVLEQQTDEEFLGNGATTEFNMVHTVPASSARLLLVLVSWLNDDLEDISSITWDPEGVDQALTEIASYQTADDSRVKAYFLTAPIAGSAKNVEVIFDAAPLSTSSIIVDAYALSGVDQTSPIRDEAGEGLDTSIDINSVLSAAVSGDFIATCNVIENATTGDLDDSTISMTTVFSGGSISNVEHVHGYGSADGAGETITCTWGTADHTAGMAVAVAPISITYEISGITKDKDGVALGSCLCFLCKDNGDNTADFIAYVLSNASTGAYAFTGLTDDGPNYFVIAWKDLATHVFDVTDFILTPVEE